MKETNITSQAVPSGRGCPSWLFDKLQQESLDGVVIIHPTPQHRSMVLEELDLKGAVVHPHLHGCFSNPSVENYAYHKGYRA